MFCGQYTTRENCKILTPRKFQAIRYRWFMEVQVLKSWYVTEPELGGWNEEVAALQSDHFTETLAVLCSSCTIH